MHVKTSTVSGGLSALLACYCKHTEATLGFNSTTSLNRKQYCLKAKRKIPLSKSRMQSAISNGRLLLDVDARDRHMRRLRDCVESHVNDLGGMDHVSHAERVLVGRASMLTVLIEMQEQTFARNRMKVKADDLLTYGRTVSTLRRVFETLGLQRLAKPVPTLQEYLERRDSEKVDAEAPQD
jgi:hypothetical protein